MNQIKINYRPVDLTRAGCNGGIGGGYLKDLYTTYTLHRLLSEDDGGMAMLSPPERTFLQPGVPGMWYGLGHVYSIPITHKFINQHLLYINKPMICKFMVGTKKRNLLCFDFLDELVLVDLGK